MPRALFATPEGLHWWARVREERSRAAADKRTRRFHVLMDTAYQDETGTILPAVHPAEAAHDVDTLYTSSSN
ncbi:hypothetical protein DMH25_00355 [Streptomyces sp. WAC 01325]|nr:DUF6082 family protein [Streptomyces sp. WAC 01325]RSN18746.1 hypothetical protein DMH25_00355 [Streptomyces sp. WAC 01325]